MEEIGSNIKSVVKTTKNFACFKVKVYKIKVFQFLRFVSNVFSSFIFHLFFCCSVTFVPSTFRVVLLVVYEAQLVSFCIQFKTVV